MKSEVHYRRMLEKELAQRCAKNALYSLRAFARDLGVSPAGLSQLLNGKQGLSKAAAVSIATKLGLGVTERRLFCDSAESEHARNPRDRLKAKARLLNRDSQSRSISLDAFQVISDWYHFAILELTRIDGFKNDVAWIGKSLGIPRKAAELAIERLKRLGLIEEKDGMLRETVGFAIASSEVPSDAIKKFHSQVLAKAQAALFTQPLEERDFSSVLFPVSRADIPTAKSMIKSFRRRLMTQLEETKKKDEVYCLAIQFFSLQERLSDNSEENS